jgi:hypothetical protein
MTVRFQVRIDENAHVICHYEFTRSNIDSNPMSMHIFRLMKTTYRMLDPSNELTSAYEVELTATLAYTVSRENTGPPFYHALPSISVSQTIITRFNVVFRNITDTGMG